MPAALWIAIIILVVVIGLALAAFALFRLRMLYSRSGSFEVSLRDGDDSRWQTGIGVFTPHRLEWYRVQCIRTSPNFVWTRGAVDFKVLPQKDDVQVVRLTQGERVWHLATTPLAVSGIVSWIDSAPPVEEPTLY
ncbi:MAG: DUF2550 family protein [Actinomycetaceae bacterium]|nr:DUF2550 family protein [Actinomycetaceae bacterium]